MARCCNVVPKLAIVLLNVLTWFVAAGFIFLGVWILQEFGSYSQLIGGNEMSLLPSCVLLAVGLVLFLLGLVGCIGTVKENRCIIGLYFSLLLVIFVGLVAGVGLAYVFHQKIDSELHQMMEDGFRQYNDNGTMNKVIDSFQSQLHCCGVDNYTDWLTLPWHENHPNESYPDSCCQNRSCSKNTNYNYPEDANVTTHYTTGCYTKMKEEFTGHIVALYGITGGCAFVLLIGMFCACALLRDRRNRDFVYRDLGSDDGMHV